MPKKFLDGLLLRLLRGGIGAEILDGWTIVDGNKKACFRNTITQTHDCGPLVKRVHDGKEYWGPQFYGAGFHLKGIPFIVRTDTFQSTETDPTIKTIKVNIGEKNQPAVVNFKIRTIMPAEGVVVDGKLITAEKPIYDVGDYGSSDLSKIVDDTLTIKAQAAFRPIDPYKLSEDGVKIEQKIRQEIEPALNKLGIRVTYFQSGNFDLNDGWMKAANIQLQADAELKAAYATGQAKVVAAQKEVEAIREKKAAVVEYIGDVHKAIDGDMATAAYLAWRENQGPLAIGGSAGLQIGDDARRRLQSVPGQGKVTPEVK